MAASRKFWLHVASPVTQQIMSKQVSSGFFPASGFEASDPVKNHGTRLVCVSVLHLETTSGMFKVFQSYLLQDYDRWCDGLVTLVPKKNKNPATERRSMAHHIQPTWPD